MTLPDFAAVADNKIVSSVLVAIGWLLKLIWDATRHKSKRFNYTVTHNRIALSTKDPVFGEVRVAWQGGAVESLYNSTVEIENSSLEDFSDVTFTVLSGETEMLTERTEIVNTMRTIDYEQTYRQEIGLNAGAKPTDVQAKEFRHRRRYNIPVFNRGEKARLAYLTTVPPKKHGPTLVVELAHKGVKLKLQEKVEEIRGVPVRTAFHLGLFACLLVYGLSIMLIPELWLAALVCLLAGFSANLIGAQIFKGYTGLRNLLFQ